MKVLKKSKKSCSNMISPQRRIFLKKATALIGSLGLSSFPIQAAVNKKAAVQSFTRKTIYLWPGDSPNNHVHEKYGRPRLELFIPENETDQQRAAIIICPGGGYFQLAAHEGKPIAEFFAAHGIVGAVLTYHIFPHSYPLAYADASRAMRLLRQQAELFNIDNSRIGLMGFSAGGHLAATVATQPKLYNDPQDDLAGEISARPDKVILGYPVISFQPGYGHAGSAKGLLGEDQDAILLKQLSNELQVTSDNPPAFIFHTADDPVVSVENSLRFAAAYYKEKVPVALHVYPKGNHGVGLALNNPDLKSWSGLLLDWLRSWINSG
jgi:acetyl esterase/lipase